MKHILVVDDNKSNLVTARTILNEKYKTTAVVSGMHALKFLENNKPDLILLDINMPDMDGFQTLMALRKTVNGAEVPVIFVTADNDLDTEVKCLESGAQEYISKPFVPAVMYNRIGILLELQELRNKLSGKA